MLFWDKKREAFEIFKIYLFATSCSPDRAQSSHLSNFFSFILELYVVQEQFVKKT